MKILEKNKLIAEFMGAIIDEKSKNSIDPIYIFPKSPHRLGLNYCRFSINWIIGNREYADNEERYDNSWDWLIPVIGKISNQYEEIEELDGLKYALLCDDIDTAWKFVVDYLQDRKITS